MPNRPNPPSQASLFDAAPAADPVSAPATPAPESSPAGAEDAAAPAPDSPQLPLPAFLIGGDIPGWRSIVEGMRLTGHFIERDLLTDPRLVIAGEAVQEDDRRALVGAAHPVRQDHRHRVVRSLG